MRVRPSTQRSVCLVGKGEEGVHPQVFHVSLTCTFNYKISEFLATSSVPQLPIAPDKRKKLIIRMMRRLALLSIQYVNQKHQYEYVESSSVTLGISETE